MEGEPSSYGMGWKHESRLAGGYEVALDGLTNQVEALHPLYVIPWDAVDQCFELIGKKGQI